MVFLHWVPGSKLLCNSRTLASVSCSVPPADCWYGSPILRHQTGVMNIAVVSGCSANSALIVGSNLQCAPGGEWLGNAVCQCSPGYQNTSHTLCEGTLIAQIRKLEWV